MSQAKPLLGLVLTARGGQDPTAESDAVVLPVGPIRERPRTGPLVDVAVEVHCSPTADTAGQSGGVVIDLRHAGTVAPAGLLCRGLARSRAVTHPWQGWLPLRLLAHGADHR